MLKLLEEMSTSPAAKSETMECQRHSLAPTSQLLPGLPEGVLKPEFQSINFSIFNKCSRFKGSAQVQESQHESITHAPSSQVQRGSEDDVTLDLLRASLKLLCHF